MEREKIIDKVYESMFAGRKDPSNHGNFNFEFGILVFTGWKQGMGVYGSAGQLILYPAAYDELPKNERLSFAVNMPGMEVSSFLPGPPYEDFKHGQETIGYDVTADEVKEMFFQALKLLVDAVVDAKPKWLVDAVVERGKLPFGGGLNKALADGHAGLDKSGTW